MSRALSILSHIFVAAATSLIIAIILLRTVTIPQDVAEIPQVNWHSPWSFGVMLLVAGLLLALIYKLRNISPQRLFIGTNLLFSTLALVLLVQYSGFPRADAGLTFEAMEAFLNGNTEPFSPGGYIHRYPHQIGLMYYYLVGFQFFGGYRWIYYFNLLWALASNWAIWRIVKDTEYSSRAAEVAAILLPLFFLPHLLFILYGYNHVPSVALCLLGIFSLQKAIKNTSFAYSFWSILAFSSSILLRQNFKILIIAVLIVLIIETLKRCSVVKVVTILALAIPFALPPALQLATEAKLEIDIGKGVPTITWVTFGLQDSRNDSISIEGTRPAFPGWYNGYSYVLWNESNFDYETAKSRATQDLKHYASLRWHSHDHGASFFLSKVETTWTEPTYQALFFGALPGDNFFEINRINNLYEGGRAFTLLVLLLRGVSFLLFVALLVHQIHRFKNRQDSIGADIISLALLGGFLFHLAWETKSAYVFPYVLMATVPAALSFSYVSSLLTSKVRNIEASASRSLDA